MTTAKKIRQLISDFPDNCIFATTDLTSDFNQQEAAARALQRMAKKGEISKIANGKYYKPRMSIFGELKPSPAQIAKEYLIKDGKTIGYLTGGAAFSQYSLTTQISKEIQIGTNRYRRPLDRGDYRIQFILQPNYIEESYIDLLQLLDCIRFIKDIPATTPDEACSRIICILKEMSQEKIRILSEYALKYGPSVRALLGAIFEKLGLAATLSLPLRQSLNGTSKYILPISESVLPNKSNWRIYEPAH